jgi:hypothetical protein
MTDPSHPMARLLAAAGDRGLLPARPAPAAGPAAPAGPPGAPARPGAAPVWSTDAAPSRAPAEDELRPVHVAEPEPEPEASEPATLESLAARFGAPGAGGGTSGAGGDGEKRQPKGARDRSREARERQAAILARLRQGDG